MLRSSQQSGKTSLIYRVWASLKKSENHFLIVFIDFQRWNSTQFDSTGEIWKSIADEIAYELEIENWDDSAEWNVKKQPNVNFTKFLKNFVLQDQNKRLFLCIDKVDRLFDYTVSKTKEQFFRNIRGFYNQGANDPYWNRVSWLLSMSSEPHTFIKDLNQSPFNIGLNVDLPNFEEKEVRKFISLFKSLHNQEAKNILDYVGGKPFLVHLVLYNMEENLISLSQFIEQSTPDGGVFRDHLDQYLHHFLQNTNLSQAMKQVVEGKGCEDTRLASQLESLGLVIRNKEEKLVPSCELYREFFSRKLK